MRPDVKFGVVTSLVVVVVAGGYFLYRDKQETPIPLANVQVASKVKKAKRVPTDIPSRAGKAARRGPVKADDAKARWAARNQKKAVPSKPRNSKTPRNTSGKVVRKPTSGHNPFVKTTSRTKPASRNAGLPRNGSDSSLGSSGTTVAATSLDRTPSGPKTMRRRNGGPVHPAPEAKTEKVAGAMLKRTDRVGHRTSPRRGSKRNTSLSAASPSTRDDPTADKGRPVSHAAVETHRTQPGDTLASLAREYYGDEKYTRFLAESNPQVADPNRIGVGALIKLPPAPPRIVRSERTAKPGVVAKTAPPNSPRSYTVRSGDSFYGIARDELGDATRWKELFKLNRALVDGDPKRLRVGQVIALPKT